MAQNDGSRARPWANVPLPEGPWAPLLAIAAVIATVALVANGPRIGGESPTVPDGRAYASADATATGTAGHAAPDGSRDAPPFADRDPAAAPPVTPRPRRRTPAASHRKRRQAPARPRTRSPRGRAPAASGTRVPAGPAPGTAPDPPVAWRADAVARRPPTPHRTPPISSAEREFGP